MPARYKIGVSIPVPKSSFLLLNNPDMIILPLYIEFGKTVKTPINYICFRLIIQASYYPLCTVSVDFKMLSIWMKLRIMYIILILRRNVLHHNTMESHSKILYTSLTSPSTTANAYSVWLT